MRVFLKRRNIRLSAPTVHKYMNKELGLSAIVRRKKIKYQTGKPHKVFPNLIEQDFTAEEINQKWCTDFTYLSLTDGSTRYNCSILDLHDRSIVSSITELPNFCDEQGNIDSTKLDDLMPWSDKLPDECRKPRR